MILRKFSFPEGSTFQLASGDVTVGVGGLSVELSKNGQGWYMDLDGYISIEGSTQRIRRGYHTNSSTANYVMKHGQATR